MEPLRVLVTGAAGQIGYSLVHQVARGDVFGERTVTLVLLDIAPMQAVLDGVVFELQDCALPLLHEVVASVDEKAAFKDIDAAFLVGAMPRKQGMERKDLLAANVRIFKSQGEALKAGAKENVKVVVVGNPANTNALICAEHAAPRIPAKNITAMTRLDHNRSMAQIALRCGRRSHNVCKPIIWGNHSSTQFPDMRFAKVDMGERGCLPVPEAVNDEAWLRGDFIGLIQKRGAVIIEKRKLSSAMSAAKAACDHMRDWFNGTKDDQWVSMAVPSDGSYGITAGIVYSFPVTTSGGEWKIVQGLAIDDFARGKMDATLAELVAEKKDAEEATH